MNELIKYVTKEAETKKKTPEEWLTYIAANASKCQIATHIGKFVNPKVGNVTVKAPLGAGGDIGYITTSNTDCEVDIATSAAFLPTAKFLQLKMEDGKSVYHHLKEDKCFLKNVYPDLKIDYEVITNKLLDVESKPVATDARLSQVYFPIDSENEAYHLLTVLPSASLIVELHDRIKEMEVKGRAVKDNKNKNLKEYYSEIYNLTEIGFGGSKPQNISYKSNQIGGRSYLLQSMPPIIQQRSIHRPRKNFFTGILSKNQYESFKELHHNYEKETNNIEIRSHVRDIEMLIINRVLLLAHTLRNLEDGWTDIGNNVLPMEQKIWLDNKYKERRQDESDWQRYIVDRIIHWFIDSYEYVEKREKLIPIKFGDGEYNALKHRVNEAFVAYLQAERSSTIE